MSTLLTLLSLLSALLVVTSTSTVNSVLWLVTTFLVISTLLAFLNLGFVALLYVIVYVGAIAILFLFVLQLLDLQTESNKSSTLNIISPIAILFSLSIFTIVVITSYVIDLQYNTNSILSIIMENTYSLNNISSLQIGALSDWLYGTGLLPLITICIILLVAMIAPISLCKDEETV